MNDVQKVIQEICQEEGISFTLVSKDWIILLEKNGLKRSIVGYKFSLNSQASGLICDDKYAFYEVLKHVNIPVLEHRMFYKNYNKEEVFSYVKKHEFSFVCKSNTGTCGKDMFLITKEEELFSSMDTLLKKCHSISLSPFVNIKTEYRAIILQGKMVLCYGKKRPIVTGNGKDSIYDLLCSFNAPFFSKIKKTKDLERVSSLGEVFEYNWQFNLSKGAVPFLLEDKKLIQKIENLALQVHLAVALSFASIDIVELENGEFYVLEANSGVMMENFMKSIENGKDIAKNIYKAAIEDMFL